MKKLLSSFLAFFAFFFVGVFVSSCSDDDNEEPTFDLFLVAIEQDSVQAKVGDQISFVAALTTYKSNQDPSQAMAVADSVVEWSSDNTSILSINPTTGDAEALAGGNVKVIAKFGLVADTCDVFIAPDVYICGYENDESYNAVATVWKNGTPIRFALSSDNLGAGVRACCVDGKDLYAAGYYYNENYKSVAVVWKNGEVLSVLSNDATLDHIATGIAVKDGDVYVSGSSFDADGIHRCTLWKNGVATYLSIPDNAKTATSAISVSNSLVIEGDDIYVGGMTDKITLSKAVIWKNGVATVFEEGAGELKMNSLYVKDGVTYLTATKQVNELTIAQIWIDGALTELSDGTGICEAYSVGTIGSDLYISGGRYNENWIGVPLIWKNFVATDLTEGIKNSYTLGLTTFGNDLYVAGTELNDNYVNQVKLWKNGEPTFISDGTFYTYVYQVYVH